MKTVKAIVKRRLKELGWRPYDLAKAVKGKMSPQTVYNFVLRGAEMNTQKLGYVLEALDMEIRPKSSGRSRKD